MDTDPKHEITIKALDAATSVEEIQLALGSIGHEGRKIGFVTLMAEMAEGDRVAKASTGVKANELIGRFASRFPHVVATAERVNMTSHPKFVGAIARVMQG
jgi:CO dehydrogenase/acetyl-CoA synthase delta subunit